MYNFHKDKQKYFNIQKEVTKEFIFPFLESSGIVLNNINVLEIGCAEAGVLKAFLEEGNQALGIELNESRAKTARHFLSEDIQSKKVEIINKNIYDFEPDDLDEKFELIILKDVIEHIPNQEKFIPLLKKFLKPKGVIFFAFPPWYMPFGGHQQICRNKWLSRVPWIHLFPLSWYRFILKSFGEDERIIKELIEIKETGITIERLHRILQATGYKVIRSKYWLFNPIYKWKFNINAKELPRLLRKIPIVRNFYTTAYYITFTKID